eukprot:UN32470
MPPGSQNQLVINQIKLPIGDPKVSNRNADSEISPGKLQTVKIMNHPGSVYRARLMPQNSNIIATKSSDENVYIFDTSKQLNNSNNSKPDYILKGHKQSGYGLSWNPSRKGMIISSGEDSTICLWDINDSKTADIEATCTWKCKEGTFAEHVVFSKTRPHMFSACYNNKSVCIMDTRKKLAATTITNAHRGPILCSDFNPFDGHFLLTSSGDKSSGLWDLRKLKRRLHTFEAHFGEVTT